MRRGVLLALAGYLAVGAVFGVASQPQQLWACADADAPQGVTYYGHRPAPDCTASVTVPERMTTFGVASALWLPLVALRAL